MNIFEYNLSIIDQIEKICTVENNNNKKENSINEEEENKKD